MQAAEALALGDENRSRVFRVRSQQDALQLPKNFLSFRPSSRTGLGENPFVERDSIDSARDAPQGWKNPSS